MTACRPQDIGAYRKWLEDEHEVRGVSISPSYYESVSNKIYMTILNSAFWNVLIGKLSHFAQQYFLDTHYPLFSAEFEPELTIKPFASFLNKTFRKNILHNPRWPEAPDGGWLLPDNWYTRINDVIRTLFVVKYLDGASFLAERFGALLGEHDLPSRVDFEAKEEGYYAVHLYTQYECEIPREDWDTRRISVNVEIQITTQLQEVIRVLLHKYYEKRRIETEAGKLKWQWDYTSEEFAANYLGHILHYVEGMIMDIREKQEESTL